MEPEKEVAQCYEQMNIVEKYETVIAYLYPIAQNIPRKHGVAKAHADTCNLFNHLENRYDIHCHQHP